MHNDNNTPLHFASQNGSIENIRTPIFHGTIYINCTSNTSIIINKFCSFENQTPSTGQFAYFEGKINSTLEIIDGGNSSVLYMMYQQNCFGSLSKINISNRISSFRTAFNYYSVESIVNVSFCNFENSKGANYQITVFLECSGRIERCNYINNSPDQRVYYGFVYVYNKRLHIFDSSFQNKLQYGCIYIHRCSIDSYSTSGHVYASKRG